MKLIQAVKAPNRVTQLIKSQQSVEFKIGDAGKIIEILRSKIYSHPIQTLVQEYLCNARDAVREVKGTKIIVTLPSRSNPTLSIRDFGPGIDKDRMLNTFVSYGSTTKDGSNEQTGGFGLGSKLAWAYTDTFTIVTFVNGTETQYVAHIGKNKNGTLELISETSTNEANGTEIRVPVELRDIEFFEPAVYRATAFWEGKERPEIVLDGETLVTELPEVLNITDAVSIYRKSDLEAAFGEHSFNSKMVLAVDGIAYPLSHAFVRANESLEKFSEMLSCGAIAVFHVGNGQVEVAASRETISENERAIKMVTTKTKNAGIALQAWKKAKLNDAKSLSDFIQTVKDIREFAALDTPKFTDADGEVFSMDPSYGWRSRDRVLLKSDNIEKADLAHFDSDGSKKRRSKWDDGLDVDLLIIIADEPTSKARQTMKVTQHMRASGESQAVLVSKGTSTEKFIIALGEKLGATMLSSIILPKVERAQPNRASEGCVKVKIFKDKDYSCRKSSVEEEVDLEHCDTKFIYMNADDRGEIDQYNSLREFVELADGHLCSMGVNAIKSVQGHAQFISVKTFLENPAKVFGKKAYKKLLEEASNVWVEEIAGLLEPIGKDDDLLASLMDRKLAADLNTVGANLHDSSPLGLRKTGDFLMDHLLRTESSIADLKALNETLPKYIKANYPLVKSIRDYDDTEYDSSTGKYVKKEFTNKQFMVEVIAYLNGKAK